MTPNILQLVILTWVFIRVASAYVIIATTEPLSVYHNGQLLKMLGRGNFSLPITLEQHDVLALTMTPDPGAPYSVKVATNDSLPAELAWRFAEGNVSNAWIHRFWEPACMWDEPLSADGKLDFDGGGTGNPVHFRAVVGNPCEDDMFAPQILAAETAIDTIKLSVAIHDQAWVFVNGQHLGDISSWNSVWTKTLSLTTGDVIGIKVMAGTTNGGVLALAQSSRGSFATRGNGWRVARVAVADTAAALSIGYDDCKWGEGSTTTTVTRASSAPSNANYVWPTGTGAGEIVVARFIVGYENRCGKVAAATPSPRPDLCSCTKLPANDWSDCYYYTDAGLSACAVRKCDDKYVCTSENTGMVCVRKISKWKVVPVDGRVGVCTTVADNAVQYMPYQQW